MRPAFSRRAWLGTMGSGLLGFVGWLLPRGASEAAVPKETSSSLGGRKVTTLTYDFSNPWMTSKLGLNARTTYTYDGATGALTVDPFCSSTTYLYDAAGEVVADNHKSEVRPRAN